MFKNYLLTTWRSIKKNKLFSLLNILGLAIGLASFILIAHYILDELSYDKWVKDHERIYRVDGDLKFGGNSLIIAVASDPMGPTLVKDYPQVEQYVRFWQNGSMLIKKGNDQIREQGLKVAYVDSTVLDVFSFNIISGEKYKPLNGRDKVMISESAARKYFGTMELEDIIGKTIETNDQSKLYTITAIMEDIPRNTHFDFDFLFSMANAPYGWGNWLSNNLVTYVKLKPGVDYKSFNKNFRDIVSKYAIAQAQQVMDVKSLDQFESSGNHLRYALTPLTAIHLHSNKIGELGPSGNAQYVKIFSIVAVFILLIACINFMNLATAKSANRAKEVGVRKVLGTDKTQLIIQFLAESTMMSYLSILLGIALAVLLLNTFNQLASKEYAIKELFSTRWIIMYGILPVIVGILAGIYPAFYLSSFKPIAVLKSKLNVSGIKDHFRAYLVVFQFITSILLIVGSIVVYRQLQFIHNTNVGFDKEQVLIIDGTRALGNSVDAFKDQATTIAGITNSTYTSFLPVSNSNRNDNVFFKSPTADASNGLHMQIWNIDDKYIPMLGMEIKQGRNFDKDMKTDSFAVILNEEAVRLSGYTQNILDQSIYGFDDNNTPIKYSIIGVVKNFNYSSLRENVGPLAFFYGPRKGSIGFKITNGNPETIISQLETIWRSMSNGAPFSYRFLDESFDEMYRGEQRIGRIAFIFSILAIFIACLGLLGLASYVAEQRTKEIGIRKVLGAKSSNIISLLSNEFIKLVIIAFLIAVPISYYFMKKWLQEFAYRIDLSWWMFVVAGVLALLIAVITVSSQALRAAWTNPIKSLRTE